MIIKLPSSYPLKPVEIDGNKTEESIPFGVGVKKWRAWMLASQAVMISQNGNILDSIKVFKRNISLHFQGVDDCAICYSIICSIDRTVPRKICKTCKHKFHGACLFKWFQTSNQSSCPLCRSTF
jgi:hypothetical protein